MEELGLSLFGLVMLATEVYLTVFVCKRLKNLKTFPKVVLVCALVSIWLININIMFG